MEKILLNLFPFPLFSLFPVLHKCFGNALPDMYSNLKRPNLKRHFHFHK